jgi:hypothetical protein
MSTLRPLIRPKAATKQTSRDFAFVPQAGIGPSIRSKSSPAPEKFFSKCPPQGAETISGQVFGRGTLSNFQNPKAPLPGVAARAMHRKRGLVSESGLPPCFAALKAGRGSAGGGFCFAGGVVAAGGVPGRVKVTGPPSGGRTPPREEEAASP